MEYRWKVWALNDCNFVTILIPREENFESISYKIKDFVSALEYWKITYRIHVIMTRNLRFFPLHAS
jgi:hypothetical protein